jgi:hypothetical protein
MEAAINDAHGSSTKAKANDFSQQQKLPIIIGN